MSFMVANRIYPFLGTLKSTLVLGTVRAKERIDLDEQVEVI